MNLRTFSVSMLALICGASAAMGVNQLNKKRGGGGVSTDTVPVVVAASELARGSMLSSELVKLRDWPKDMVPSGALTDLEAVRDRTVKARVIPGELILEGKLAPAGAGHGLASMIPQGMRAFTIRTPNIASGVAGFILPGNRVDVLLTTSGSASGRRGGGGVTTTLLQNMEILAVDQRLDAPEDNKIDPNQLKSVTLLVTPDQAAKLGLATNNGILQLSLRRPEDNSEADTFPATMADLRFFQDAPLVPVAKSTPSRFDKVAGALTNVVTAAAAAAKDIPVIETQSKSAPKISQIRTIRGSHRATVQVMESRSANNN